MTRVARTIGGLVTALCLALALILAVPSGARADLSQTEQDYVASWLATAERAEQAIEAGRASNAALEALRREIVTFRRNFEDAREQNAARIDTLQSQLSALGPAPEEGVEEPSDIAILRDGLNKRINTLRVPVVVSNEAFNRANGLISEIDRIIRDRQARRLFSRTPAPMPNLWPVAWADLVSASVDLANETRVSIESQVDRQLLRNALPEVLLLTALGLLLLIRGSNWAERIGNYFRRFGGRGYGVWGFVISLGRIGLPLIGVFFLAGAVSASRILGLRGELLLDSVPYWAALLLGYRWLSERLYPRRDEDAFLSMSAGTRAAARRNLFLIGVVLVLRDCIDLFEQIENVSDASRGVIGLPLLVLASLVLLRMRQVLLREERERRVEDGEDAPKLTGLMRISPYLRQVSALVAVATPALALAGYGPLAEAIMYPFLQSIALFGLVVVLQRFVGDVYAWASGKGQEADDSIVPALTAFALFLASLPFLALIWGARITDLTELWERFLQGVSIGGTRISPTDFLTFAVIFSIGYTMTRLFQGALANNLLPKTKLDLGGQNAVVSGVGYVGIFLAALIAVSTAGIDLSSLAIVAGALSVGIGFGLQTIVSNFVSGIILLIERPISEGDWIEVGGNMGYVRDISVRSTRIETFDRSDVIVPNSDLISGTVTNYTRGETIGRVIVPVGVAYGTDTRRVETILREIAQAHPMVLLTPPPNVVFMAFGADSLDFEIRAILRDVNWVLSVKSDMNHEINRRFVEEGIEIPFAQRDVWLRNPETLSPPAKPTAPPDTDQPPFDPDGAIEIPDKDAEA